MSRKAKATSVESDRAAGSTAAAPAAQASALAVVSPPALIALAEELGRLLARREMTRHPRRRGYGLLELVLGAAVVAALTVLAYRLLGGHPH